MVSHKGEIIDFEEVAAILCEEDPAIRSVQLAPDGVVTCVYPEEGNEGACLDLFVNPLTKEEAELARDTDQIITSGPYELVQGGTGLVVRNPIFLEEENGQKTFWGFSIVILNVPEIFDIAEMDLFDSQEYYFRLWRYLSDSGEVQVIAENTDKELKNAIQEEFSVTNSEWYLDIAPQNKWVFRPLLYILIGTSTIIMLLTLQVLSSHLTVLEQKEELIRQNNTDGLTGTKNGRFFMSSIRQIAADHTACAIFYLDLNSFKEINDQYGHDEGDKILIEVAKRIESCVRDTDIVARIGGDEFTVIIMTEETEEYCLDLQERIKQKVAEPYVMQGVTFYPSISAGFARYPSDSEEIEKVMRTADQKMYKDKRKIKGTEDR